MRLAVFDIETWDLSAAFGPVLCVSVLSVVPGIAPTMKTFRQDAYVQCRQAEDMTDDRQLLCEARDWLEQHHITAGWFSKGFDLSHVRTRLVSHGERRLEEMLHIDPIWAYKGWRGLKTQSARLKHVAEFYGLSEHKQEVEPEVWLHARLGKAEAMDLVQERCESDVRLTWELLQRTLDNRLIKNIGVY